MLRRLRSVVLVLAALALLVLSVGGEADASRRDTVRLRARLNGAQEVPPADPDGRGTARMLIDAAAGQVCFDLRYRDSGTPNRGHIHSGGPGVNGPIVVTFFELRSADAPATDPRHDELEEGHLDDCVSADPTLLADIVNNPGNYYVNLHNARFPGGALRCQIER